MTNPYNSNAEIDSGKSARTNIAKHDLQKRTKCFALDVIRFFESLPKDETSRVLGRQLLRSGTSVGANYRSAKRAKSNADFINKMTIVEEEADECGYWLELLTEASKVPANKMAALLRETSELVAISVASINTARRNGRKS
jgi:four helix bundle protein